MAAAQKRHHTEWQEIGGIAVVRFTTRHLRDEQVIEETFDALTELSEQPPRRVLLNFTGLEICVSWAIGKLVRLNDRLQPPGGRLALCCLPPFIDEILRIMRLRKRFNIYATEEEALQSFV